jgi:succinate dehydrogenase hydrophobic anchor subunit
MNVHMDELALPKAILTLFVGGMVVIALAAAQYDVDVTEWTSTLSNVFVPLFLIAVLIAFVIAGARAAAEV